MMKMKMGMAVTLGALALSPTLAQAQNDTASTAANLTTNGPSIYQYNSPTFLQRWYRYEVTPGQSYCVETATAFFENKPVDTVIDVFEAGGTTLIGTNDDAYGQPDSLLGSRLCYIATAFRSDHVRVRPYYAAIPTAYFQIRVSDNMLYSPWWLTDDNTDAFIQLRNTTNRTVAVTVTARNTAGAVVGAPLATTLPANGGTAISIKTQFGAASGSGSAEIASDAAPGAVVGNITTLNVAQGVSFVTPFSLRQQPVW